HLPRSQVGTPNPWYARGNALLWTKVSDAAPLRRQTLVLTSAHRLLWMAGPSRCTAKAFRRTLCKNSIAAPDGDRRRVSDYREERTRIRRFSDFVRVKVSIGCRASHISSGQRLSTFGGEVGARTTPVEHMRLLLTRLSRCL